MTCSIATPPPPTTSDRIAAALARLGDTPDAVAATLTAAGITGAQCETGDCPVARYVRAECGIGLSCLVLAEANRVSIIATRDDGSIIATRAVVPSPVSDFIRMFDGGDYPALIAPSTGPAAVIQAH